MFLFQTQWTQTTIHVFAIISFEITFYVFSLTFAENTFFFLQQTVLIVYSADRISIENEWMEVRTQLKQIHLNLETFPLWILDLNETLIETFQIERKGVYS